MLATEVAHDPWGMDIVVVITDSAPRESDIVEALRPSGLQLRYRRLSDDVEELILERPDVVVVDVPDDRRVPPVVEPILQAQGLESIGVIAVIGEAGLHEASGIGRLADIVLRPLRAEELVARVRRPLLARGRESMERIEVGELLIDIRGYEASVKGERLDLTYQEFKLLKFLASHPGRAFTREQLLARVWGYDFFGGSRTVDIHVRRIRAKVGHPYAGCLRTIRNVGYKWVPELK